MKHNIETEVTTTKHIVVDFKESHRILPSARILMNDSNLRSFLNSLRSLYEAYPFLIRTYLEPGGESEIQELYQHLDNLWVESLCHEEEFTLKVIVSRSLFMGLRACFKSMRISSKIVAEDTEYVYNDVFNK